MVHRDYFIKVWGKRQENGEIKEKVIHCCSEEDIIEVLAKLSNKSKRGVIRVSIYSANLIMEDSLISNYVATDPILSLMKKANLKVAKIVEK